MKTYLGDSVYAEYVGFYIRLYLDNGNGPYNEIVLEPEGLRALDKFREANG